MRKPHECPSCSSAECEAACRFADACLQILAKEKTFETVYDRGSAVGLMVLRFIEREQIDPNKFIAFIANIASQSFVAVEKGSMTCH